MELASQVLILPLDIREIPQFVRPCHRLEFPLVVVSCRVTPVLLDCDTGPGVPEVLIFSASNRRTKDLRVGGGGVRGLVK